MTLPAAPTPDLLDELAAAAAALTGFSREAILPDAIRRAARTLLTAHPPEEVLAKVRARERDVHLVLTQAVTVGETFFFRQPEHFRFLGAQLLPELIERKAERVRAWSAGCATGEEAWSIAACLRDLLPPGGPPAEVLGTDLLARNLAVARAGTYGAWSQRPSAPLIHPVVRPLDGTGRSPLARIEDGLRGMVRFAEHNLLQPAAEGPFEVIFCRNVLVYFSPEAGVRALAHLAAALAPGGALLLGSMDAAEPPPGLVAFGPPQDQIWRKPDPALAARRPPPPAVLPPATPLLPLPRRAPEPIALHLRALVFVERGDHRAAAAALGELVREAPDYVPGLLERALLHVRLGEPSAATHLMKEVLRRAERLPPEELVAAPEPLPASFFVHSAVAWLSTPRVRG